MKPHAWIEVSPFALENNFKIVNQIMGPECKVIAVVKANAYGHGIEKASQAFVDAGAGMLAVSFVEEASRIRKAGITTPLLLMTPPRGDEVAEAISLGLECCVMDPEGAEELHATSIRMTRTVRVHLKIDTGMSRLGMLPADLKEYLPFFTESPWLELAGIYSHCAQGTSEPAVVRQLSQFQKAVEVLRSSGIQIPLRHIAASAASLTVSQSRLDAVRIGTILYGQFPTSELRGVMEGAGFKLEEPWKFKSRIIALRSLPPGVSVGYGAEYTTHRVTRMAVVSAGVADGFGVEPVSLRRKGIKAALKSLTGTGNTIYAEIRGMKAPVIGRVATQLCCLDVTDLPDMQIGDEVTLPVRRLAASAVLPIIYSR